MTHTLSIKVKLPSLTLKTLKSDLNLCFQFYLCVLLTLLQPDWSFELTLSICSVSLHQANSNASYILLWVILFPSLSFPPISFPILSFFFQFIYFYLFLAALGLCCCVQAFSSCGEQGLLFVAVHRLLIVVASLVVEHGLQVRRLNSCGTRAQLLHSMWDLPRPGLEPVSATLACGFLITVPPGKPRVLSSYLFQSSARVSSPQLRLHTTKPFNAQSTNVPLSLPCLHLYNQLWLRPRLYKPERPGFDFQSNHLIVKASCDKSLYFSESHFPCLRI